jgi:hypothetical protein
MPEDDGKRGKAMQGNIGQVKRTGNGKKAKSIDSDPIDFIISLQAVCAVMRKLLHAIHGMLKHDKPFDNTRFYAIPAAVG